MKKRKHILVDALEVKKEFMLEKKYKNIRKKEFAKKPGIYALYNRGKLYYIGHTSDLNIRLKEHHRNRHSGKWDKVSLYFTKTVATAKAVEAIALSLLLGWGWPKGNKQEPKVRKKNKNIEDRILKAMKKITEEIVVKRSTKPSLRTRSSKKGFRKIASQDGAQKRNFQLKDFFSTGFLSGRHNLKAEYKAKTFYALLLPSGEIEYQGVKYLSPSFAAKAAKRSQSENGWTVWKIQDKSNKWITLDALRSEASGFKANTKPIDKAS